VSDRPADSGQILPVNIFRRVWKFLKKQIVQDIPEEDAACEFDCHVNECTMGEWLTCEHRLRVSVRILASTEPPNPRAAK
jgi:hypothetical protein